MNDMESIVSLALECGFSKAGELNISALEFRPEVREMCEVNRCGSYGKSWTCPPACGSLEEIAERASKYERGIIVQTVGTLEDDFDYEAMQDTAVRHNDNFMKMSDRIAEILGDILPMGAGGCKLCEKCAYPDAACRFPSRAFPSMEAYGLFVSDVCEKSGMPYYNGKLTITYTSCFLFDKN